MEKYGYDIIHDAFLNKGTAFSVEERKKYHLEGLLPPCIDDIKTQADRIYRQMERKNSGIEKRRFLMDVFNHNRRLNGQRLYLETGILKYGKGKADTEAYTGKRRRLW